MQNLEIVKNLNLEIFNFYSVNVFKFWNRNFIILKFECSEIL